jgi:hypothetical protein
VEPVTTGLVYACVVVCLVRGVPVIAECVASADLFRGLRSPAKPTPYDLPQRPA